MIGTGFDFNNSQVTQARGSALQFMLEAVNRRGLEIGGGLDLIMDAFDSLLSGADIPEIIVNISCSPRLLRRIVYPVALSIMMAI